MSSDESEIYQRIEHFKPHFKPFKPFKDESCSNSIADKFSFKATNVSFVMQNFKGNDLRGLNVWAAITIGQQKYRYSEGEEAVWLSG